MARKNRKKVILNMKDMCPLPKGNIYSKLTLLQLSKEDPSYFIWMIKNCLAYNYGEDVRQKVNKLK